MYIIIKVLNNANISEQEVREEILSAEIRINTKSKIRFHLEDILGDNDKILVTKIDIDHDLRALNEIGI